MDSPQEHRAEWLARELAGVQASGVINSRALAAALRAAIAADQIPVGARLPTERELARTLGVGRTTVVSAYNLLRGEALIRATQGAGTWVARRPVDDRDT
jgi:DNA-binding GntR family transcriptional regulator